MRGWVNKSDADLGVLFQQPQKARGQKYLVVMRPDLCFQARPSPGLLTNAQGIFRTEIGAGKEGKMQNINLRKD